jgi:hypothetical protein
MFLSKTAGLDGSDSVGDGVGCRRSSVSSSMRCSVGEVILALAA